ncbi:MAG: glycerol-3-phosphate acyltransferase [Anaerolineales bacterium]
MLAAALIIGAYILGSFPTGYLVVKWATGKDVRSIQSGRTGGTNAMRVAGFGAGLATAAGDILKATFAVWLARMVLPEMPLIHVAAGLAAVIGHNFSLFLVRRSEGGGIQFGGGAGGAPTVGAAIGMWAPSGLLIIPVGALILFLVGYASVTTMAAGVMAFAIFLWRGLTGLDPMVYLWFGVGAELLLLWSLRPNIQRLIDGEERLVGLRARKLEEGDAT